MFKIYRFYNYRTAIDLLRPNAVYAYGGDGFVEWNDPRPCPSWDEVEETMQKIKDFEDSLQTIYLNRHLEMFKDIKRGELAIEGENGFGKFNSVDGFHGFRHMTDEEFVEMLRKGEFHKDVHSEINHNIEEYKD